MNEKVLNSKEMDELFEAMLQLKSKKEAKNFMRDLCTIAELQAMSERFQVVKLLKKKTPYREIARKTGSSTATITRIAHWLHHGMGGYELVLKRLKV